MQARVYGRDRYAIFFFAEHSRVLAQGGEQRVLSQARYCVGGPAATECRTSTEANTSSQDLNFHGCLPVNTRSSFLQITAARAPTKPRRYIGASQHRGVQYVSTRYTERLAEAGIEPSVGSRGDSYDNALAESIIGLYKTEVIRRRGPWRGPEDVEFATLEWVHWYNTQRLLEPIGNVSPVEYEMNYYRSQDGSLEMARLN